MFHAPWWLTRTHIVDAVTRRRHRGKRRPRPVRPWLDLLEERRAPTVNLAISNPVPFSKPDTGQLMGMFVVTRSGDLMPAVQVNYQTQDGSGANGAHAGVDYMATSGTLSFAPNQTMATINVPVLGNNLFQADKTFTVSLSNPSSSAVDFRPPQTFATGYFSNSVAVADFNGDGKPDLAIAGDGVVSLLLNTTPVGATIPSFAPAQTFASGNSAVAVGDFNGDGKPDLVFGTQISAVEVLVNTTPVGATTFSFAPPQTFAAGISPASLAVGDFNGDGKLDLAIGNASIGSNTVSVLLNTTPVGATTLSFAPPQSFAAGTNPVAVAVGDFNNDGKPDLAIANQASEMVSVLLNRTPAGATTLTFAPPQTFTASSGAGTLAIGDFNNDGKPDLAVVNGLGRPEVSVLLNTTPAGATTPSFAPEQTFATGSAPFAVVVGDFNGDNKLDLVVLTNFGPASMLLNTTPTGATTPSFAPPQTFAVGTHPNAVAVGDFNGDGEPDLAITNAVSNTVSVLLNNSITLTGSPATGTISAALEAPTAITVVAGTTPQSAVVKTAFATPLAVDVRDAAGNLVQGVSVTFTAPASGPSGQFGSDTSVTVVTSASGRATAPTFTSNTSAGSFTVTAQAAGGGNPSTSFSLTNILAKEVFVLGLDQQVYAQKLDAAGTPTGGYFQVASGIVQALSVGHDAGGRPELFVIGLDGQVYALKFDGAGNSFGTYFLVGVGAVKTLSVGHDAGGQPEVFVIGLDDQVYAHKLDATGSPLGSYFLTSAGAVKTLSVSQNAAGQPEVFVIGLDDQVYAQKFDANGNSAGPYFLTQSGQVKTVRVGQDAQLYPELFVLGLDDQVYTQKFDANGNSASGYALTQAGQVKDLAVGQDAMNHPLLDVIGLDDQVYAQKFDANGNSASSYALVQAGQVKELHVGMDAGHLPEVFVTGLDDQVYGQKFDSGDNPLGGYFLMQAGRQNGFVVA